MSGNPSKRSQSGKRGNKENDNTVLSLSHYHQESDCYAKNRRSASGCRSRTTEECRTSRRKDFFHEVAVHERGEERPRPKSSKPSSREGKNRKSAEEKKRSTTCPDVSHTEGTQSASEDETKETPRSRSRSSAKAVDQSGNRSAISRPKTSGQRKGRGGGGGGEGRRSDPRGYINYYRESTNQPYTQEDLRKGNNYYLYSLAKIYDITDLKRQKEMQYWSLLLKQRHLGFRTSEQCEGYIRYLSRPRTTDCSSSSSSSSSRTYALQRSMRSADGRRCEDTRTSKRTFSAVDGKRRKSKDDDACHGTNTSPSAAKHQSRKHPPNNQDKVPTKKHGKRKDDDDENEHSQRKESAENVDDNNNNDDDDDDDDRVKSKEEERKELGKGKLLDFIISGANEDQPDQPEEKFVGWIEGHGDESEQEVSRPSDDASSRAQLEDQSISRSCENDQRDTDAAEDDGDSQSSCSSDHETEKQDQ